MAKASRLIKPRFMVQVANSQEYLDIFDRLEDAEARAKYWAQSLRDVVISEVMPLLKYETTTVVKRVKA